MGMAVELDTGALETTATNLEAVVEFFQPITQIGILIFFVFLLVALVWSLFLVVGMLIRG